MLQCLRDIFVILSVIGFSVMLYTVQKTIIVILYLFSQFITRQRKYSYQVHNDLNSNVYFIALSPYKTICLFWLWSFATTNCWYCKFVQFWNCNFNSMLIKRATLNPQTINGFSYHHLNYPPIIQENSNLVIFPFQYFFIISKLILLLVLLPL